MASILHGKPRLAKAYGVGERAWHMYQELQTDGFVWFTRLCDARNERLVYHAKGKAVRVCQRCLRKAVPA